MSSDYTFGHMLRDVFFNGNKVSGGDGYRRDRQEPSGGSYTDSSSSDTSSDFNPSEEAGEAFRSVFGDDSYE